MGANGILADAVLREVCDLATEAAQAGLSKDRLIDALLRRASIQLSQTVGLDPERTVSAQAAEARERGETWGKLLCAALDEIDPGHCQEALDYEKRKRQEYTGLALEDPRTQAALYVMQQWRLDTQMAVEVAKWNAACIADRLPSPISRIISGFRSLEYQMELQRRWDAGDREGLAYRPATNSDHTRGRAVDVSGNEEVLRAYARRWRALGPSHIWGGDFSAPDPNHFALR